MVLFRCTRTASVMHHRDLTDAAANPELFANARDAPTFHRFSAIHSVRPETYTLYEINLELFSGEREPPTYHRCSANHSVRP